MKLAPIKNLNGELLIEQRQLEFQDQLEMRVVGI
jgi:hypothetical protein